MANEEPASGAPSQQDLQQLALQGRAAQEQLQEILEQQQQLEALQQNLDVGRETLEALQAVDEGEEVLLPVGGGAFVRATLADADNVLVDLGSDVVIESDLEEAVDQVRDRLRNVSEATEQLEEESERLQDELVAINQRLQQAGVGLR